LEKDLFGARFPSPWEKIFTMGERLVLCLLCMLPGRAWLLLVAGWLWLMYHARTRRVFDATPFNLVAGSSAALLAGIAGRVLLAG
ncbi:MAG: hypothetical protein HZB91_15160, partial [Elusimicrobia bacterium]|nr:hypothetical protein [Elusimicrobiota bacterium]